MNTHKLTLLLFCHLLLGCEPWPNSDIQWNLSGDYVHCGPLAADHAVFKWSDVCGAQCDTLVWDSTIQTIWRKSWPEPIGACSLQIQSFREGLSCESTIIAWDSRGKKSETFAVDSFAIWVLMQTPLGESKENTVARFAIAQDSMARFWWTKLPLPLRFDTIAKSLLLWQAKQSKPIDSDWVPWSAEQLDSLLLVELRTQGIAREDYLRWPRRRLSVWGVDSLLDPNWSIREVGRCISPATEPFWVGRGEASRAQCGLGVQGRDSLQQAVGISWELATACAQRQGGRLPTLAEWRCARGLWSDTLPADSSQRPFAHWLADTTFDGRHLIIQDPRRPEEIRPQITPENAAVWVIFPPADLQK